MKPLTKEWITKAEGDYKVALREKRTKSPVYEAICFHAQQCVEKYFKALLQEYGIPFPKTHDLLLLLELCSTILPKLKKYREELARLTVFAVNFRYPGETAEVDDAWAAYKAMVKIRRIVRKFLLGK